MQCIKVSDSLTIDDAALHQTMFNLIFKNDVNIPHYPQELRQKSLIVQVVWETEQFKHTANYIFIFMDGIFLIMKNEDDYINIFQFDTVTQKTVIEAKNIQDALIVNSLLRWTLPTK